MVGVWSVGVCVCRVCEFWCVCGGVFCVCDGCGLCVCLFVCDVCVG